jgi:hypothetical protein
MPPKRVSMKGKGADIFFGGDPSPGQPAAAEEPASADRPTMPAATKDGECSQERVLASLLAREQADATAAAARGDGAGSRAPSSRSRRSRSAPTTGKQEGSHGSALAGELARHHAELVDRIRRTVKVPGREVSYMRLTPEEKAQLAKIVYDYRSRGRKTTENEINRIAVNFMLLDYQANGEDSLLARVIDALFA